jgi:hypothetical protein
MRTSVSVTGRGTAVATRVSAHSTHSAMEAPTKERIAWVERVGSRGPSTAAAKPRSPAAATVANRASPSVATR